MQQRSAAVRARWLKRCGAAARRYIWLPMYVLEAPGRPEAPPRLGDGAAERARPRVRRGERPRVRPAPVLSCLKRLRLF
jgi:hypothetical protein